MLKDIFILFLVPVLGGLPGEGPDGHVPSGIEGLVPVPARIPAGNINLFSYSSLERSWWSFRGTHKVLRRDGTRLRRPRL